MKSADPGQQGVDEKCSQRSRDGRKDSTPRAATSPTRTMIAVPGDGRAGCSFCDNASRTRKSPAKPRDHRRRPASWVAKTCQIEDSASLRSPERAIAWRSERAPSIPIQTGKMRTPSNRTDARGPKQTTASIQSNSAGHSGHSGSLRRRAPERRWPWQRRSRLRRERERDEQQQRPVGHRTHGRCAPGNVERAPASGRSRPAPRSSSQCANNAERRRRKTRAVATTELRDQLADRIGRDRECGHDADG